MSNIVLTPELKFALLGAVGSPNLANELISAITLLEGTNVTLSQSVSGTTINSSGGGGGANQTLSNLTAPTSVNEPLIFQSSPFISLSGSIPFLSNSGTNSVFLGSGAGNASITGGSTVGIGYQSLKALTSSFDNTAIGFLSGTAITSGAGNTAVGSESLNTNITGSNNSAFGANALKLATLGGNSAFGFNALASNTTGTSLVAVGNASLGANTSGNDNTGVGYDALTSLSSGANNTSLGANSGSSHASYSECVLIGSGADTGSNGLTNVISIGYNAVPPLPISNLAQIGNSSLAGLSWSGWAAMTQIATPGGAPPSGYDLLYFKSDDNLYRLNSSGVEAQVGGGGSPTYAEFSLGSSLSGSVPLDFNNGYAQAGTVVGNVTFGAISNMSVGATLFLELTQGGSGNNTYAFTDTVEWGNLGPPTPSGSGRRDRLSIYKTTSSPQFFEGSYLLNYIVPGSFTNTDSTSFNGTNQYITLGNNINLERTDAFSWSFWVKPTSLSGFPTFIGKLGGGSAFAGYQIWSESGGKIDVNIQNTFSANAIQVETTSAVLSTGIWQQIVITYDGSSSASGVKIYVNGSSQSLNIVSNNLSGSILTSNPLFFGADDGGGPEDFYNGLMDEVALWNIALSSGNVTSIYNSGTPNDLTLSPTAVNLVDWWRLGDPSDSATTSGGFGDRISSINGTGVNMSSGNIVTDVP